MKYVISWFERPQGSPIEYENTQKRILEVFGQWKAPANFKIEFFLVRVGELGGHMLVECDDPVTIHKFCSMLPAFVFEVHPVIRVEDAIQGELEVIAWRDGLKKKCRHSRPLNRRRIEPSVQSDTKHASTLTGLHPNDSPNFLTVS
jgi:hypothetical protein